MSPLAFNPCQGAPTRFAPLWHGDHCVPTLYAAQTLAAGAFEYLFHDVPPNRPGMGLRQIAYSRLMTTAIAEIEVSAPLVLLPLFAPQQAQLGFSSQELTVSPPALYPNTTGWASALWEAYPQAQGLLWASRQYNPDGCILLFGDRVDAEDVLVLHRTAAATAYLAHLHALAREGGIRILR